MSPRLETLPTELVLDILDYLKPISRHCLSFTCRRLYRVIGSEPRSLSKCQKWYLMTKLEKDLVQMPEMLACALCKCKRPVYDFGYEKPWIGERAFRILRWIPLVSSILHFFPSLHCWNMGSLHESFKLRPSTRWCYRHRYLWYSSYTEKSEKTVPRLRKMKSSKGRYGEQARYVKCPVLYCGHCGAITEDDDNRDSGCKHCLCDNCPRYIRRQYFRVGEGDHPRNVVEQLVVRLGRLYLLERWSKQAPLLLEGTSVANADPGRDPVTVIEGGTWHKKYLWI